MLSIGRKHFRGKSNDQEKTRALKEPVELRRWRCYIKFVVDYAPVNERVSCAIALEMRITEVAQFMLYIFGAPFKIFCSWA